MARKLRIQYPGAVYHVMNRGDLREPIFKDEQDYESFLQALSQACQKARRQAHTYCLMPNHFHLVIETPQTALVVGMKWLLGTYTGLSPSYAHSFSSARVRTFTGAAPLRRQHVLRYAP